MSRGFWPAFRTTGIMLAVAMLPAIYTEMVHDAREKDMKLQTISNQVVDLKLQLTPRLATIDQEYADLNYRVEALEGFKPFKR